MTRVEVGLLVALVALVGLLLARQRRDAGERAARQQSADILRTVKDGLFLLDQNLIIGSAHSSALGSLLQRSDLAGLSLENLLRDLVPEKTLSSALKYVRLLWAERTKEKLLKSINPLTEVEVQVDDGRGERRPRFLEFDFNRVRTGGKITQLLVSVSDVTGRVDLARELRAAQSQAQGQVDTLLGILHVDPAQLTSFLSDSTATMRVINTVLREPAREEGTFRKKLDTLFRLVHAVKGESAALGLSSIESRAHSFEDDLQALRGKTELSGNDFLPLVIKLDDLLTHLQSVGEWVGRLSRLHAAPPVSHTDTTVIAGGAFLPGLAGGEVGEMLQNLAARVAGAQNKDVLLQCMGFDTIPDEYRALVKDICVQAVRNAVVHGIEGSAERIAVGKPARGVLQLIFQDLGDSGYKLIAEDDGQGLSTERIKASALKLGLLTPEKAQTLDARQVYALIFKPGFSTWETASADAGRGVGMNLMANLMQEIGGKLAVASVPGKFTRLTLTLPQRKSAATEAA